DHPWTMNLRDQSPPPEPKRPAAFRRKRSCESKLRHMRQRPRWYWSDSLSSGWSSRSQAAESRREASRQLTLPGTAGLFAEPVFFKACAQPEARPMEDDPTIGRRDALVLTDGFGFL